MSFDINSIVRKNILNLKPYSSARDDFQTPADAVKSSLIYLDANENPYSTAYNRYPDPHQRKLKQRISEIKEIPTDHILLGNGSDEAIDLIIRAFCEPGLDNVLIPQPTYGMYAVCAEINNVAIRTFALTNEFDLDIQAINRAADKNSKVIFLCSPNNPSGNILTPGKIITLIQQFNGLVVVDEAYVDFTEAKGFVPRLPEFNNLMILQTLSKAWGLAGLRLGICFAARPIIDILNKIKPPYNIGSIAQSVAIGHLSDPGRKNKWVEAIKAQREMVKTELEKLPIVTKVFPSQANFLLVRMTDALSIYTQLVQKGVIVRDRSSVALCNECLRITIGTEKENEALLHALKTI